MAKEAAVMELLWDLIRGKTEDISRVTYTPQKPAFLEKLPYEQPFERTTPESQGIPSGQIEGFLRALGKSKELNMHSVMVLRNGKVIGETGYYPYSQELWHMCYSVSKSVVSMAIGFLISEEKLTLDTKIVDIFKKYVGLRGLLRQKDLTVRHLLTMTSGVGLNEVGAISGNDWVKHYLEAPVHHEPGEFFEYNSMNSYMLSAVVTELTGETLVDYLKPRLFAPLGITRVFWESCPKGINKGGWGLFLCTEDLAKLGQLYLDGGIWKGIQVVPEEWVRESLEAKVIPEETTGFTGYGYQIWRGQREGSFAFNGMLGQNVFVYPDVQMVIVTTGGSNIFFNSNELQKLLQACLPKEGQELLPLAKNREGYRSLINTQWELSHPKERQPRIKSGGWHRKDRYTRDWKKRAAALSGRRFELNAAYVGLFPLMGQVFHNNYTEGIREVEFLLKGNRFYLKLLEGQEKKVLPVGIEKAEVLDLDLAGEMYRVAVEGSFADNEDGEAVLTVTISYLEEAICRRIKFIRKDDGMEIRFSETPGKDIALDGMSLVAADLLEHPLLRRITEKGNVDLVKMVLGSTFEPVIAAKEIPSE